MYAYFGGYIKSYLKKIGLYEGVLGSNSVCDQLLVAIVFISAQYPLKSVVN